MWFADLSMSDRIALVTLVFTVITTVCVLFLAYAALAQTARPNLSVLMLSPRRLECNSVVRCVFEIRNVGHWYGSPIAVDVTVYCNFPPAFELQEILYGSVQELHSDEVEAGVGGMRYLKARGLEVSHREEGEEVHVITRAPLTAGRYQIRLTGYSPNDASFAREFEVDCFGGAPEVIPQATETRELRPREEASD